MTRGGVKRLRGADVDEKRTTRAFGLGHGQRQIFLGVRERLKRAVVDPHDDQAVFIEIDARRVRDWHADGVAAAFYLDLEWGDFVPAIPPLRASRATAGRLGAKPPDQIEGPTRNEPRRVGLDPSDASSE